LTKSNPLIKTTSDKFTGSVYTGLVIPYRIGSKNMVLRIESIFRTSLMPINQHNIM